MDAARKKLDDQLARRQTPNDSRVARRLVPASARRSRQFRSIQGACGGGWRQGQRCGRRRPQANTGEEGEEEEEGVVAAAVAAGDAPAAPAAALANPDDASLADASLSNPVASEAGAVDENTP